MPALHVLSFAFGAAVTVAVLGSALKTVVLPQEGLPRLPQAVFALVHRLMVRRWNDESRTSSAARSLYAPVALVSLPLVWMILIAFAFSFLFWGTGSLDWQHAFEVSASSLTTLGFAEPSSTPRIAIAFVEATIGLGLVALLISYLPTIYSAYNSRERGIIMLNPIAGIPPTVTDLISTLHQTGSLDGQGFWRRQADWVVDVEQTHTAFPILTYFPEAQHNPSWVASIGVILDAAAVIVSASEAQPSRVLADEEKGPLLSLVYGTAAIDRTARAANVPLPPAVGVVEIIGRGDQEPPPISVTRDEYRTVLTAVAPIIGFETRREDDSWHRFASIRSTYDQPLRALAGIARGAPAPWTTDRPAHVGRPRLLRQRQLPVDWTVRLRPTGG
jgi:hypothetical protein